MYTPKRFFHLLLFLLLYIPCQAAGLDKDMRDSLALHYKLASRAISNARTINIKEARSHANHLLSLADSLQQPMADYWTLAGQVEDMSFNYERNKPATGGKTDEKECLSSAKQCYIYCQKAYNAYIDSPLSYNKKSLKNVASLQQKAMDYYLITKGFHVNAGQSFKEKNLEQSLDELVMSYQGAQSPFLLDIYHSNTERNSAFATYLADSSLCRTFFNCATLTTSLGRFQEALAYYDSLKVRNYQPDRVYRNTVSIYSVLADTLSLKNELQSAISTMPEDTWFQKNLLQIHIDRHEWDTAKVVSDRIIELDSTDVLVLNIVGQLHEIENHPFEALQIYLKSYGLDSLQMDVCSHIGRIYYNRVVQTKEQLYNQRRTSQYISKLTPLYDQVGEWFNKAYLLDTERKDPTIAQALREMLYFHFTQTRCPNRAELIARYNEISRNYGLDEFGR